MFKALRDVAQGVFGAYAFLVPEAQLSDAVWACPNFSLFFWDSSFGSRQNFDT